MARLITILLLLIGGISAALDPLDSVPTAWRLAGCAAIIAGALLYRRWERRGVL